MNRVKVFVCYSTRDRHTAGVFKEYFEKYYGFEVFLAHENLSPSDDWPKEILDHLRKTDLVILLISESLSTSCFANQEIGLALAWGKKVIPISIDGSDPEGFIDKKQAHKCKDQSESEILKAITIVYNLPIEHPKFKYLQEKVLESLISAFANSDRFKTTSVIIDIMWETSKKVKFSKDQISKIVRASKTNYQIYGAVLVTPKLSYFLSSVYKVSLTFS